MSSNLRKALVFTFVVGLSSTSVSNALWACGGTCGGGEHSSHESGGHVVQTKAEVKGEKAEVVKRPGMRYGRQRYQKGTFRRVQREGLLLLLGTLQKDL